MLLSKPAEERGGHSAQTTLLLHAGDALVLHYQCLLILVHSPLLQCQVEFGAFCF